MFFMSILLLLIQSSEQNVIATAQGKLRGTVHDGYVSYNGIPYATIISSAGRFKAAGLAPTWNGIRESKTPHCSTTSSIDECLKLDVYVPTGQSQHWPVLVWISGGGANYNPKKIVLEGVIVVIVYHRVGLLGFLCLGDEDIPGNAGLKDTVLALRWVRDNIAAFKGNPAKVTVSGQGFGAAMVEGLTLSPMSEGLYHGVILQSGSIIAPWAFNYDAKERAKALIAMFQDTNIKKIQTDDLVENSNKLNVTYFPFGICMDKHLKREEIFLNHDPYSLLTDGKAKDVPMIIGYNSEEAYIFASILKANRLFDGRVFKDINISLPKELIFANDREVNQVEKQIEDVYFGVPKTKNSSVVLKFYSDAYFTNHIYRSIGLHVSSSSYPVYVYQFSHLGRLGVQSEPGVEKTGAAHSDELTYIFGDENFDDDDDGAVQRNMVKLWTNFVKYLNPSPNGDPIPWEPINTDSLRLLDISTELKMKDFPAKKIFEMWNNIYEKFYYIKNRLT